MLDGVRLASIVYHDHTQGFKLQNGVAHVFIDQGIGPRIKFAPVASLRRHSYVAPLSSEHKDSSGSEHITDFYE